MAADDSTSWGEVCNKVGFADNLYADCRKNVPGFSGSGNRALDVVPDDDGDWGPDSKGFSGQLADSALAIPDAPGADWKSDSFFGSLPIKQILMYGGVAALFWFFVIKAQAPQAGGATAAGGTAPEKLTSPKAA